MSVLYIDEYNKSLKGKIIWIACREGILRDHLDHIISDIKFLNRQAIQTVFFHNISNRFANQKLFRKLESKLFKSQVIRIPHENDFYQSVLNYHMPVDKIVFLERTYIVDQQGNRINSMTTDKVRQRIHTYSDLISNDNLKRVMNLICTKIEAGEVERVHILPAGKNKIKTELFSIEGTGTLIANNFNEVFLKLETDDEIDVIAGILKSYRGEGYLKPRTKLYIQDHKHNFYAAKIDHVIVGCAEKIVLSNDAVELGSLAVSTKFRSQQIGLFIVTSFIKEIQKDNFKWLVSLTNNPKLQDLLCAFGFEQKTPDDFIHRQACSPKTKMFIKKNE